MYLADSILPTRHRSTSIDFELFLSPLLFLMQKVSMH